MKFDGHQRFIIGFLDNMKRQRLLDAGHSWESVLTIMKRDQEKRNISNTLPI